MQSPAKAQISLREAIGQVRAALGQNNLAAAEKLSLMILQSLPEHSETLHLLAIILQRQGKLSAAIDVLKKAAKTAPSNGTILANLCEMQRMNGDLSSAVSTGKTAVKIAPLNAIAQCNLGMALLDQQNYDAALLALRRAIEITPNFATAYNNIATALRKKGDLLGAEQQYRNALKHNPDEINAGNNLISLFLETDQSTAALELATSRLKKYPKDAELHRSIGRAFLQLENLDAAERAFRNALALKPDHAEAMLGLSEIFGKKKQDALAFEYAQKAAQIDPTSAFAHQQMGQCQADLGNVSQAFEYLKKSLTLDPNFVPALVSRGSLHMENGDLELANLDFARVAELKPESVEYLFASVRIETIKPNDPRIAQLENLAAQVQKFRPAKAIAVHYALAKCYEDIAAYDEAFAQYALGAKAKRATITYDAAAYDEKIDAIIDLFDATILSKLRLAANPSVQPIFVLGMPRSGTTLIESLIASHPHVFGAGELNNLQRLFRVDTPDHITQLRAFLNGPSSEIAQQIAKYITELDAHASGFAHITDKMPSNFMLLGLISAVLPNAKIIHVSRDAMDTCLSCFTRLFERSQYQSYDLQELGRYYNGYAKLMRHWQSVLPEQSFYTISYESLVNDPEAQARALIDYCGLPWDDACLSFHSAKRRVRTASVTQVRQPMYSTSVAKWKHYEKQLAPLVQILNLP